MLSLSQEYEESSFTNEEESQSLSDKKYSSDSHSFNGPYLRTRRKEEVGGTTCLNYIRGEWVSHHPTSHNMRPFRAIALCQNLFRARKKKQMIYTKE